MATQKSNVIYDGFTLLDAGIHSGIAPTLLKKNQMGFATNLTVRGGYATDRPPYNKINLATPLPASLWQGACNYQPDSGNEGIVVSIAGRLFLVTPDNNGNATCVEITIAGNPNPPSQPQVWMTQAENYMIVNDGVSLPLFFNGTTTVRSRGNQQSILGTTSANFVVPAIGSVVAVTLTAAYAGTLGEVVLIGDATYQVVAPPAGNLVNLQNLNDAPGTNYLGGTNVINDPNNAVAFTGPTGPFTNISNGTVVPLGVGYIPVSPPYAGATGATIVWPTSEIGVFNWTEIAADGVSVSLRFNAAPGSYTFTVNHNSILQYSPGGKPTQVVGVAAAPFIAPAVDAVLADQLERLKGYMGARKAP